MLAFRVREIGNSQEGAFKIKYDKFVVVIWQTGPKAQDEGV
jgi:hypothetical protein